TALVFASAFLLLGCDKDGGGACTEFCDPSSFELPFGSQDMGGQQLNGGGGGGGSDGGRGTIGVAGSGSGSSTGTTSFSCDTTNGGTHVCLDYSGTSSQLLAAKTACMSASGSTVGSSCSHTGAAGGCLSTVGGLQV